MSARKREETYSVRLPSGSPHVASSAARQMLEVLFAQRIPLVNDPGSGEEYLKLTLPRAQVHALQALAGGDAAGVALRRLVTTFAGSSLPAQRPVRALMAPVSPVVVCPRGNDGQIIETQRFPKKLSREVPPRERPRCSRQLPSEPPPWYGLGAEQWAREGREVREYVLNMQPLGDATAAVKPPPSKSKPTSPSWGDFLGQVVLPYLFFIGFLFLFAAIFGGSNGSGSAASGSRFPQWRPK